MSGLFGDDPPADDAPMAEEGYVDLEHGRVWYRRSGGGDRLPILLLHGGPGAAAYYLEPLEERLAEHRPVVVYDQLGCGRSDMPDDPSLWTLDYFTGEVDRMREAGAKVRPSRAGR